MVDPQQRLLLEATASLLPAAAGASLLASAVGVFVGISNPDYANIKMAATPIGVYSATGTAQQLHYFNNISTTWQLSHHPVNPFTRQCS